jgi:hypothetical protein
MTYFFKCLVEFYLLKVSVLTPEKWPKMLFYQWQIQKETLTRSTLVVLDIDECYS